MTNDELSLQYHSIRFYNGKYSRKNVNYRIGNTTTVISDEIEKFYDTWIDFHLIPSERPTVAVPPAGPVDRIVDMVPDVIDKVENFINQKKAAKEEV